jgi:hypothetical protein
MQVPAMSRSGYGCVTTSASIRLIFLSALARRPTTSAQPDGSGSFALGALADQTFGLTYLCSLQNRQSSYPSMARLKSRKPPDPAKAETARSVFRCRPRAWLITWVL